MKKTEALLIGVICCGFFAASCRGPQAEGGKEAEASSVRPNHPLTGFASQYPVFSVAETAYDFDTIHAGEVVAHSFRFKNTGSRPLIIQSATSTCGCTVPTFSREPVRPGGEGALRVVFSSAGKSGNQVKPVIIRANTMPDHFQLKITAEVLPPNS